MLKTTGFFALPYFVSLIVTHDGVGTFAVVCMMASKSVLTYSVSEPPASAVQVMNFTELNSSVPVVVPTSNNSASYTPVQVATAVCFVVGLWQVSIQSERSYMVFIQNIKRNNNNSTSIIIINNNNNNDNNNNKYSIIYWFFV